MDWGSISAGISRTGNVDMISLTRLSPLLLLLLSLLLLTPSGSHLSSRCRQASSHWLFHMVEGLYCTPTKCFAP